MASFLFLPVLLIMIKLEDIIIILVRENVRVLPVSSPLEAFPLEMADARLRVALGAQRSIVVNAVDSLELV